MEAFPDSILFLALLYVSRGQILCWQKMKGALAFLTTLHFQGCHWLPQAEWIVPIIKR